MARLNVPTRLQGGFVSGTARAHYYVAHVLLAAVVLQFLLAGLGSFGVADFTAHAIVGTFVQFLGLVILILGLVSRRARGLSIALGVLAVIQGFLPGLGEVSPIIAALHVLNAAAILYLAAAVFRGAPLSLRAVDRGGEAARAGGETADAGAT